MNPTQLFECSVLRLFLLGLLCEQWATMHVKFVHFASGCIILAPANFTPCPKTCLTTKMLCGNTAGLPSAADKSKCSAAVLRAWRLRSSVPEAAPAVTHTPSAPQAVWTAPPTPSAPVPPSTTKVAHTPTSSPPARTPVPATAAAAPVIHNAPIPSTTTAGACQTGAAAAVSAVSVMQMMTEGQTGAQRGVQIEVG